MNTANLSKLASSSLLPQLALILITVIWGGTFLTVQFALNYSSPMFFVGCRFAAAALAVLLLSWRIMRGLNLRELLAGFLIGCTIAIGYGTQTIGLQTISSSESAFLTAVYVPLVPFLLWIIFRKTPHIMTWIGVILAFSGLVLLTGNGFTQISFSFGQALTLFGAIAIALEIILIGYFAGKVDLRRVTVIQLVFTSVLSFMSMPFLGEHSIPVFSWQLAVAAFGLGISSAIIQLVMNWAQRYVESSRAAIIYAGEPIWASLFGRLAGERLAPLALIGGALVVLSIIISEWRPKFLGSKDIEPVTEDSNTLNNKKA